MRLDRSEIEARKLEDRSYGPWTSHNLQLRDDLCTIRPDVTGNEWQAQAAGPAPKSKPRC